MFPGKDVSQVIGLNNKNREWTVDLIETYTRQGQNCKDTKCSLTLKILSLPAHSTTDWDNLVIEHQEGVRIP